MIVGPVAMLMVTARFSGGTMTSECLKSLREKLMQKSQFIIDELDLSLTCPQTPNIVLRNTSGSMIINGAEVNNFIYDS